MDEKMLLAFCHVAEVKPTKSQLRLFNIMAEKRESLVINSDDVRHAGNRMMNDNIRKFREFFR